MPNHIIALLLGFLLDLWLGDPYFLPHPVCAIGKCIQKTEKLLRRDHADTEQGLLIKGGILVVMVLFVSTAIPVLLLFCAYKIHLYVGVGLEVVMCYQILATKSLKTESMKVYRALQEKDIEKARHAVSMIVGRDTEHLDEKGIIRAAVETVAENTSDGIIAPMLYLALGGAELGFFYKAVNTMDSMVGYKNEKYLYFGRAAARLDDVMNFIPARISALLMVAAGFLTGLNGKNAFYILKRDGRNHASPNSAQTEAAAAGALEVQLAGNASYFGKLYEKPTIGDARRTIENEDIIRVNRLLYATAFLCMAGILLLYGMGGS